MGIEGIVPSLLSELGIPSFSPDPMEWEHSLYMEFGDKGDIKTLLTKARENIFGQLPGDKKRDLTMGLYAIYTQSGECLYIGKSKNLYSRFYIHYQTSIGKEKVVKYREFFTKRPGPMTFKWIQIQFPLESSPDKENEAVKMDCYKGETLRIALERLITCHMLANSSRKRPTFEHEHPSIK